MLLSLLLTDVFTDKIVDVSVTTSDSKVQLTVKNTDAVDNIVSVVLDTYNNSATFYGLRETIESYMRMKKLTVVTVKIKAVGVNISTETAERTCRFFYVAYDVDEAVTDRFFITRRLVTIPNSGSTGQTISLYATSTSIIASWTLTYRNADGTTSTQTFVPEYNFLFLPVKTIPVSADALRAYANATPIFAHLKVGLREMDFALLETIPDHVIAFLNAFNVMENIWLEGVKKEKTLVTKSTAICGEKETFYDISQAQEFEFESGPLHWLDATTLKQVVVSPYITLNGEEILIKEHSLEIADSNEELNNFKFTFFYADNKLRL